MHEKSLISHEFILKLAHSGADGAAGKENRSDSELKHEASHYSKILQSSRLFCGFWADLYVKCYYCAS